MLIETLSTFFASMSTDNLRKRLKYEVLECAVLTIFETLGKKYIALLPLDENGENENGDVFLYRYIDTDPEAPDLENIIDDDEYEAAADAFDEWMDAQEFEYLEDEE